MPSSNSVVLHVERLCEIASDKWDLYVAMTRRRHSDEFRAGAVLMLESAGWPEQRGALTRVSQHLKIDPSVLYRWATKERNPPPDEVVEQQREFLVDAMRNEVYAALGEMEHARSEATYRDLGIVVGVLVDKIQLLTDEPTQNIKNEIQFIRTGITTLPQRLTSSADTGAGAVETI